MAFIARRLVSQNKNRLKGDGFDLDLTYLTDEIICMGLPSKGVEALYRNPIDEVVRFMETNHGGKYKVFNLCTERTYDIDKFGSACDGLAPSHWTVEKPRWRAPKRKAAAHSAEQ